jgi:hypothetical protein
MKKLIFTLFLLPAIVYAKSSLVSNVPLPKTYVLDLDPYPCNEKCMQDYLNRGMIFSFLSHANTVLDNSAHEKVRAMNVSILNLGTDISNLNLSTDVSNQEVESAMPMQSNYQEIGIAAPLPFNNQEVRIAILLPYNKIGKYAASTTDAVLAYLMGKNHAFDLRSYKIESESTADITKALQQIKEDGFTYVIAPLTQDGMNTISAINPDVNIYFPTIHKSDSNSNSTFFYYGGIDYKAQSNLLLQRAVSPLVIFYDQSTIGSKLAAYEGEQFQYREGTNKRVIKYSIPGRTTNMAQYLKGNGSIQNASFFINTPIVKTGMIMSQITLYDVKDTNILSTQINYDPLLLSMTQYDDRKNMILANSITQQNDVLVETNALLSNDIVYDWINYTTTVGADYFFNLITHEDRAYNIALENNQMKYEIELLKPTRYRFTKLLSDTEE